MKYSIEKLEEYSGKAATVYTVRIDGDDGHLFDRFVSENLALHGKEVKNIAATIKIIGTVTGARMQYFKEWEGVPGDGVCALYDSPSSNLRLYCIRYGTSLIVIGSGGHKPKNIRSYQDNKKTKRQKPTLSNRFPERLPNG